MHRSRTLTTAAPLAGGQDHQTAGFQPIEHVARGDVFELARRRAPIPMPRQFFRQTAPAPIPMRCPPGPDLLQISGLNFASANPQLFGHSPTVTEIPSGRQQFLYRALNRYPKFLGYIPQRFKVYGQTMAHESAQYLRQIKRKIYENVASVLRELDADLAPEPSVDPIVGQVKDFASLVQTAQREGVPLWKCSSTYVDQKEAARLAFKEIATQLIATASSGRRSGWLRSRARALAI